MSLGIGIQKCLASYLITKSIERTFGANESFWTEQQSCIILKVSLRKWCPFFVFVCFSGCHFTKDGSYLITKSIKRTFEANESFWTKQQSCIILKVSLRKWCPFFVFVCFSGCHFTKIAKSGNSVGKWSVFLMICVYLNMLIDKSKAFSYYIFTHHFLHF